MGVIGNFPKGGVIDQKILDTAANVLSITYYCERGEGFALNDAESLEVRFLESEDFYFSIDRCLSIVTILIWVDLNKHLKTITEDREFFCHRLQQDMKSPLPTEIIREYLYNPGQSLYAPDGLIDTWRQIPVRTRANSFLVKVWLFGALTKTAAWFIDKSETTEGQSEATLSLRMNLVMEHLKLDEAWGSYLKARLRS